MGACRVGDEASGFSAWPEAWDKRREAEVREWRRERTGAAMNLGRVSSSELDGSQVSGNSCMREPGAVGDA
jgi:hypothetical protein